jgi:hypothetical protein
VCKFFFFYVVFIIILFCKYLCKKKKNLLCTLRSNVSCTFERRRGVAYELTFVCSTAAPHHTHYCTNTFERQPLRSNAELTCPTCTRHKCGRTHLRTFECTRVEPLQDLFLGHFSPLPLIFPVAPYKPVTSISVSPPP